MSFCTFKMPANSERFTPVVKSKLPEADTVPRLMGDVLPNEPSASSSSYVISVSGQNRVRTYRFYAIVRASPCRKLCTDLPWGDKPTSSTPIRRGAACRACATSGHAAALPSTAINFRLAMSIAICRVPNGIKPAAMWEKNITPPSAGL